MTRARLRRQIPDAGAEALALIDPSRGVIESPIRGELFSAERFRQHGRSLGEAQTARLKAPRSTAFFPRLHDNMKVLREAQHYIGLQLAAHHEPRHAIARHMQAGLGLVLGHQQAHQVLEVQ